MHQEKGEGVKTLYNSFNEFTATVFNILNEKMSIGWSTWSHTGNQVPFFAIGQGADHFTGYLDNTDIVNILYKMMKMKNPNSAN